jgi:hypothetical protein
MNVETEQTDAAASVRLYTLGSTLGHVSRQTCRHGEDRRGKFVNIWTVLVKCMGKHGKGTENSWFQRPISSQRFRR